MPDSTYNVETDAGKVRLLISDVGGADGTSFIFKDAEIETFLTMGGSIRLAAAEALRSIAANEAQVQKVITFLQLKTDGAKLADSLTKLAEKLEARDEEDAVMDFATMDVDIFSHRILREEFLLNGP